MPASKGVHGPGEITIFSGFSALTSSQVISSFLLTITSYPSSRGIYGGAIGHISWDGDIDTAIAIRTAVIKNNKIHVGAGAGVVADSIPENEWNECLQKAHVFLDAIEMIK